MKFKIRGIRRINMPAIRATIGCSSAALRAKVIGLLHVRWKVLKGAKMAAQQPHDQDHDQDNPEYPAEAITTTPAIVAAAVIPEAASEQEDQQDDDQIQFPKRFLRFSSIGKRWGR